MPATRSGGAAQGAPKIAPTVPIIVRKRCLHARHVASRCTRCIDVCGAGALRLVEQQLITDSRRCSSCGACVAACPTEALYAVVPETHALAQEIAAQARNGAVRISCTMAQLPPSEAGTRVPCLARLSPGMLIDAVESGADCLQLTCGVCSTCSRRPKTDVVEEALEHAFIPVISTIGYDESGNCYNINADTVAAAVAGKLKAEALISMTDVAGLLRDKDDESSLIHRVYISDVPGLIADGIISGGMIPKIDSMTQAIREGVKRAFIIDGRVPHSILMEMLTDEGMGTMFRSR